MVVRRPNAEAQCRECFATFRYYTWGGRIQIFCSVVCRNKASGRFLTSPTIIEANRVRMTGIKNPMKDKDVALRAHKDRVYPTGEKSNLSLYRWSKPEAHERHSEKMHSHNPMKIPEVAKRVGDTMRRKHEEDFEWHQRTMSAALKARSVANMHEAELARIIGQLPFGFSFVGNAGCFMRAKGQKHSHVPDWIWKERKLIILYHGTFWHSDSRLIKKCRDEEGCYRAMGYSVLVLWTNDVLDHDWISSKGRSLAFKEDKVCKLVSGFVAGADRL